MVFVNIFSLYNQLKAICMSYKMVVVKTPLASPTLNNHTKLVSYSSAISTFHPFWDIFQTFQAYWVRKILQKHKNSEQRSINI